jgi:signal transduction histidine kinase
MVWNWLRRRPNLIDGAIVLLLGAIYVADALYHHRFLLGVPLALLQTVPLAVRRRRPLGVLALVTAGAMGTAFAYEQLIPLAPAVAAYTIGAHGRGRRSVWASVAAFGAMVLASARASDYASLIFFAAAWVLGDNLRNRRAYLDELEEKAERLEREREANIRRAAAEEQARISRELHDVIAHNVSVMTVQAAAARDVFDSDPERSRQALASIEATGRAALTELRRLLSSVRDESGRELAPQPGLGALTDLVERVRRAGLDVHLSVEGDRVVLPEALDLSAYRIVQEALTNTLKHASAERAWVTVRYGDADLDVSVRDDGVAAGQSNGNGGRGLIGMRERVELFGGRLETGPIAGGGYLVSAHLPVGGGE